MTAPPRQERRGPWRWPGAPTDDPPTTLHYADRGPYHHRVGDGHPGQRAQARRKAQRRGR